ncbi:hypothetical protein L914_02165 [Phytophthora nicotianae]|uniref:Uncharacterized protein n=1 Tax=Phytophthora nicotianae TaxID=4792 RepID=W2P1B7_PHYNI|nr:hypothetical protein L914_02165 [Phytophthora nicotianae]
MEALTQYFSYLYIVQLNALSPFKIVVMDTSDETSILEAARQLEGQPIDLLINNAGIGIPSELETGTKDALMKQLELAAKTNGGASVMQLSPYLGNIGSYTTETTGFFKQAGYGYSSLKAALNMITRSLAFDLQPSGIVIVSVHPGYVDTDMTQGKATLKPEDSVMAMTSLIGKLNHESTGNFFNLDPQIPLVELPW